MLVEKKRKRGAGILDAGSMADISFLLLIFFLVTTTMDTDKGIPMVLPERGGEAKINPKNITKVLVNKVGDIFFDNKVVTDADFQELLESKIKERGYDSDLKPKLIVSIKTDRNTDYERYITVLDIVKESGATKISIAEPEK